ncbi:BMP family ABC transporter substrate-binding protein [Oribacterium parvum]
MKKRSIAMILLMSMAIVACGGAKAQSDNSNKTEAAGDVVKDGATSGKKAILIINGNLGDLGFFDSANRGMERLKNELGMDVKVVETGDDEAKWEPALADAADEPVDYVIAVSPSMVEPMQKLAPDYPEKKFILIDNVVDFQAADLSNVYCATFKQNEGSFLAGAAAGLSVEEGGIIGFIGGMDIPPINDFLVGYIEGAQSVNSGVKVISTYTGDYYDPAKGKEHAIVQFNQGVGVVFAAAGPAGLGSIEAATEQDKKIIGVDSDQSTAYENKGDKKTAEHIVTSMVKNVGDTIFRAIDKDLKGELKWGAAESLGIAEEGVGLAKNDIYNATFTDEQKAKIEEIQKEVVDGKIKVSSAIGMSTEELDKIRNSVKP